MTLWSYCVKADLDPLASGEARLHIVWYKVCTYHLDPLASGEARLHNNILIRIDELFRSTSLRRG